MRVALYHERSDYATIISRFRLNRQEYAAHLSSMCFVPAIVCQLKLRYITE
jgi:hypothetical protein